MLFRSNFHVDQKIVCVKREEMRGAVQIDPVEIPQVGMIYTVRRLHVGSCLSSAPGIIGILVSEIDDQFARIDIAGDVQSRQVYYEASNFRPLIGRKTDISQFQRILADTTTTVSA